MELERNEASEKMPPDSNQTVCFIIFVKKLLKPFCLLNKSANQLTNCDYLRLVPGIQEHTDTKLCAYPVNSLAS